MPDVTKDQLRRLQSAAEEIQRVISEIETANLQHPPAATVLIRCAAASPADDDDIIVAGEPE